MTTPLDNNAIFLSNFNYTDEEKSANIWLHDFLIPAVKNRAEIILTHIFRTSDHNEIKRIAERNTRLKVLNSEDCIYLNRIYEDLFPPNAK